MYQRWCGTNKLLNKWQTNYKSVLLLLLSMKQNERPIYAYRMCVFFIVECDQRNSSTASSFSLQPPPCASFYLFRCKHKRAHTHTQIMPNNDLIKKHRMWHHVIININDYFIWRRIDSHFESTSIHWHSSTIECMLKCD